MPVVAISTQQWGRCIVVGGVRWRRGVREVAQEAALGRGHASAEARAGAEGGLVLLVGAENAAGVEHRRVEAGPLHRRLNPAAAAAAAAKVGSEPIQRDA